MMSPLRVTALVCSLKPSPAESSSELIAQQVLAELGTHETTGEVIRVADYDVRPGVDKDMSDGDEWPAVREKVIAADILLIATPTWVGHMSSIAQRVLERLDAELSETDEDGRPHTFGKVAIAAVVGNEDGAHKIIADLYQSLNDIGFSVPAQGATYWNSEAMNPRDYKDLAGTPDAVAATIATMSRNAAHLARLLGSSGYPAS